MNHQPQEPSSKGDGSQLDLHSVFYTIQGEGPFSGQRAVFVRLAGCNLQCPGCDTEYTSGRQTTPVQGIVELVQAAAASVVHTRGMLVVLTGGEPLRQPVGLLVKRLVACGYLVQVESNGMFAPDSNLELALRRGQAHLVVSPKTPRVHPTCASTAMCYKYVLDADSVDDTDGLPTHALEYSVGDRVARPPAGTRVYLSPYDTGDPWHNRRNLAAVARSCMRHGYTAGVQLHKHLELA